MTEKPKIEMLSEVNTSLIELELDEIPDYSTERTYQTLAKLHPFDYSKSEIEFEDMDLIIKKPV
jgi:hypothetical protein